jgi:TIR domain
MSRLGRQPVVFVSYCHRDIAWRDAFVTMLRPAADRHGAELWADDHINVGERRERVLGNKLAAAELGVLLVTDNYLTSRYSWDVEVKTMVNSDVPVARRRHEPTPGDRSRAS